VALLEECRRRGCKALQVGVGGGNAAALALYLELGLRAHGDGRVLLARPLEAKSRG
jgi:hypothetical protein